MLIYDESGALQTVRSARFARDRRSGIAAPGRERSGRLGESGEPQLPGRAHHPEQVSVQAAAAVLARQRAGRRGEGSRPGRRALQTGRPRHGLHHLWRVRRGSQDRGHAPHPAAAKMDFVTGAAFLLTYGTTDHALRDRAALSSGETLLVLGAAGGVGLAAVEVGKALGARVIACASSDEKLAVCRDHGADETINYATEDLRERIRALTGGRGADVVYDPVGGPYSEPAFRSIAWRGRHLVVGFAAGEIPKLPLNLALLKGASVVGVFWGDFARREPARFAESVAQLARWYDEGRLKPHVDETLPLHERARGAQAHGRAQGERQAGSHHLKIGVRARFSLRAGGVAAAEMALHEHAVDPAAELEADRAQRADAQKSAGCMHADGRGVCAVADHRDDLAVAQAPRSAGSAPPGGAGPRRGRSRRGARRPNPRARSGTRCARGTARSSRSRRLRPRARRQGRAGPGLERRDSAAPAPPPTGGSSSNEASP